MSSACVHTNEYEASKVTIDLRPMSHSVPVPAERPSKESRNFIAVQVTLAGP
jgi:hypothetical protein